MPNQKMIETGSMIASCSETKGRHLPLLFRFRRGLCGVVVAEAYCEPPLLLLLLAWPMVGFCFRSRVLCTADDNDGVVLSSPCMLIGLFVVSLEKCGCS